MTVIRLANGDDHWSIQGLARALALTEGPAAAELPSTLKIYVVEADNRIIGFAAIDKDTLTHLYITGGARRSGIGSALVRVILQDLGPNVEVGVLVAPNNTPALALYKSLGFQPDTVGEYAGHCQQLSLVFRTTA